MPAEHIFLLDRNSTQPIARVQFKSGCNRLVALLPGLSFAITIINDRVGRPGAGRPDDLAGNHPRKLFGLRLS